MAWKPYKEDIPILVNYQAAHDPLFPGFRLGTDRSHNYSADKGTYFYIYDRASEIAVGLKAFLKDYSIDFKFNLKETKNNQVSIKKAKSIGIEYSVGLNVPAISVNDARVNATRMETIQRFVNKTFTTYGSSEGAAAIPTHEFHFVLLSNLIHNGNYIKKIIPTTAADLENYGCPCYLTDFTFKPNPDFGFFEYGFKLWPKLYDVDFKLTLIPVVKSPADPAIAEYIVRSFTPSGQINDKELTKQGTWPFGFKTGEG